MVAADFLMVLLATGLFLLRAYLVAAFYGIYADEVAIFVLLSIMLKV